MSEYGGSNSSGNYSLDHLHTLLAVNDEAEAERSGIDLAEVSAALSDAADGMLEEIERSIYLAALDSRTMADLFWEEKWSALQQVIQVSSVSVFALIEEPWKSSISVMRLFGTLTRCAKVKLTTLNILNGLVSIIITPETLMGLKVGSEN